MYACFQPHQARSNYTSSVVRSCIYASPRRGLLYLACCCLYLQCSLHTAALDIQTIQIFSSLNGNSCYKSRRVFLRSSQPIQVRFLLRQTVTFFFLLVLLSSTKRGSVKQMKKRRQEMDFQSRLNQMIESRAQIVDPLLPSPAALPSPPVPLHIQFDPRLRLAHCARPGGDAGRTGSACTLAALSVLTAPSCCNAPTGRAQEMNKGCVFSVTVCLVCTQI